MARCANSITNFKHVFFSEQNYCCSHASLNNLNNFLGGGKGDSLPPENVCDPLIVPQPLVPLFLEVFFASLNICTYLNTFI